MWQRLGSVSGESRGPHELSSTPHRLTRTHCWGFKEANEAEYSEQRLLWPTTTVPNDWVPNDWVTMLVALAGEDAEQDIDRLRSARNDWDVESVSG